MQSARERAHSYRNQLFENDPLRRACARHASVRLQNDVVLDIAVARQTVSDLDKSVNTARDFAVWDDIATELARAAMHRRTHYHDPASRRL